MKKKTQNLQENVNLPESVNKFKYKIYWYVNIFFNSSVYNLNIIKNYMRGNGNY